MVKTSTSSIAVIAVAWFRPDEWEDLKRICPDLLDTYEEWLATAVTSIAAIESPYKEQIVKIILTAEDLRRWQQSTGQRVDARARSQIAARLARKNMGSAH